MLSRTIALLLCALLLGSACAWFEGSVEGPRDANCTCACFQSLAAKSATELMGYMLGFGATIEVGFRGFLLGFGATVLKDLLIDGKREEADRLAAFEYGRSVGYGMACTLVGASLFVPSYFREIHM